MAAGKVSKGDHLIAVKYGLVSLSRMFGLYICNMYGWLRSHWDYFILGACRLFDLFPDIFSSLPATVVLSIASRICTNPRIPAPALNVKMLKKSLNCFWNWEEGRVNLGI